MSTEKHEAQTANTETNESNLCDNTKHQHNDKLKPSKDKELIRVFFPILTGVISATGMLLCYGTELGLYNIWLILCIGTIFSVIESALIIIDATKGRLKKRLILYSVLNLIAVLGATVWRISSNWYSVAYSGAMGGSLMLLAVITVYLVTGIVATNSLVKRRKQFLVSLIVLAAVFSLCARAAVNHTANAEKYANRLEREQEEINSGESYLFEDALEDTFGKTNQSRYEESKRNANLYTLLSATTGILIVFDGIAIFRSIKKTK